MRQLVPLLWLLALSSCGEGALTRSTRANCPPTWERAFALCRSDVDCGEVGSCWYLTQREDGGAAGDARLSCISNFGENRWSCGF